MSQSKPSWIQRILFFLIFVCVLFVTHRHWLPAMGTFFLVPDNVQKADCIVVMRGDEYFRLGKAAELQKQGLAPVIVASVIPEVNQPYDMMRLLSGQTYDENETTYRILEYFDVKRESVLLTGKVVTSTYQEAVAAREFMLRKGFKSMLLVTSTYHMKRSLFLARHVFKGTGIEIYPVTGKPPFYDPEHWWTHERDVRRVAEEYVIFAANIVRDFLLKKHSSAFDAA
jgi:uncharacterized SAM-binding protein YcdF (DUF218 family)